MQIARQSPPECSTVVVSPRDPKSIHSNSGPELFYEFGSENDRFMSAISNSVVLDAVRVFAECFVPSSLLLLCPSQDVKQTGSVNF